MQILVNFGLYQLCWFASVLGGAHDLPWLGVAVLTAVVAYHLRSATEPGAELMLMLFAGLLGGAWDSALVAMGWLAYPSGILLEGTAPYWIVALWIGFATSLNISLRWLKGRLVLASVLGAVTGPLAYLGGEKLGGVVFEDPFAGLAALTVGWAMIMPLLVILATRFDGFRHLHPKVHAVGAHAQLSAEHV